MPSFFDGAAKRDISFFGEALAYGAASMAIFAAARIGLRLRDESQLPWMVLLAMGCIPALVVLTVRFARTYGRVCARCDACREDNAVAVRYLSVTGLVVMARVNAVEARLCRRCSGEEYLRTTTHTAMFGWWSLASLLTVPWVVLANTGVWLVHRTALRSSRVAVATRWDGDTADAPPGSLDGKLRRRMIPVGALVGALAAALACLTIVAVAKLARVDLGYEVMGVGHVASPTFGSIGTRSVFFAVMGCVPALIVAEFKAATKVFAVVALAWTVVTILPIGLPAGCSGPAVGVFAVMYVVQQLVVACCILGLAADPPWFGGAG